MELYGYRPVRLSPIGLCLGHQRTCRAVLAANELKPLHELDLVAIFLNDVLVVCVLFTDLKVALGFGAVGDPWGALWF